VSFSFPDKIHKIALILAKLTNPELTSTPIIMPSGEKNKNIEQALKICNILSKNRICRHSYVIAIGGGAFLDTVCFAASISHRGIRQIRFPTTVVSQCDSGLGVKNSINLFGIKNFVGTFYPPYAVINDFDFINSLPLREKISGAAEAIKVAIIKDASFFKYLKENSAKIASGDQDVYKYLVMNSAKIHSEHIAKGGDPFEKGNSRPLDFGHWLAHKLETLSKGKIRHGEAVAIGMASDSFTAMKLKLISKEEFNEIIQLLISCKLPIWDKILIENKKIPEILSGLDEFREHLGGKLCITLPNGIGKKIEINHIESNLILEGFNALKNISNQ
ncbi:MAG TPA: 3-dehydroquinate synthase, partial [Victivallales bacterium]|nr:3-dehydroquinate synthase [Victivallales bacterium]